MVSIRLSSLFSYVLMLVVLFLFAKSVYGGEIFWAYIDQFENKTKFEYNVFEACSLSPYLDDIDWEFKLRLLPYNDKKKTDSSGSVSTLLRDPQGMGCVIKLEPSVGDLKNGAKTYYIKIGAKASGSCSYDWAHGPFDILVSPVYFDIFDEMIEPMLEQGKAISIGRARFCGYQDSYLKCEITDDGIIFSPWHRTFILDTNIVSVETAVPPLVKEEPEQLPLPVVKKAVPVPEGDDCCCSRGCPC